MVFRTRTPRPSVCFLSGTELKTINDFLFQSQIDNINLFKVEVFIFLYWLCVSWLAFSRSN